MCIRDSEWNRGLRGGRKDGQRTKQPRTESDRVGRTNAHAYRAIIEPHLPRGYAEERTAHFGTDLVGRESNTIRLRARDLHRQLGTGLCLLYTSDAADERSS